MFDVFRSTFCETLAHCDAATTALHNSVFLSFVYMIEYSAFFSGQGGEGVATLLLPTEGVL